MDLRASTPQQLRDLVDWMRETAALDTPSQIGWDGVRKGLQDRALFLESYVIREIAEKTPLTPSRNTFTNPSQTAEPEELPVPKSEDWSIPPRTMAHLRTGPEMQGV